MKIIGHRGCYNKIENTIDSIEYAIQNGVDMIEIDIRFCKDDIVVCHDFNLLRLHNSKELIENLSSEFLYTKYNIPTFDMVFKKIGNKIPIFLDLKLKNNEYERFISILSQDYNFNKHNIYIASFNHVLIYKYLYMFKNFFGFKTGLIVDGIPNITYNLNLFDFIVSDWDNILSFSNILKYSDDIEWFVYGINQKTDYEIYKKDRINGIIVNYIK